MEKKKSKVIKPKQKAAAKEKPDFAASQPDPEPSRQFDFGGLPNRDLKKNLGCG